MASNKRSLSLIANFIDGYADGWFFAVGEYFKTELDILFTPRVELFLIDGRIQYETIEKKGKIIKKKLTRMVSKWTQGETFRFARGHILYDSKEASTLIWREALKKINIGCEITSAVPDTIDYQGKVINGFVHFNLLKPNDERTALIVTKQYTLTQHEFVGFLKTGNLPGL